MMRARFEEESAIDNLVGSLKLSLDNRGTGTTIWISPPIPVRIEWADSQGSVTASWLAAHFNSSRLFFGL
jgi:hypothetical protein